MKSLFFELLFNKPTPVFTSVSEIDAAIEKELGHPLKVVTRETNYVTHQGCVYPITHDNIDALVEEPLEEDEWSTLLSKR